MNEGSEGTDPQRDIRGWDVAARVQKTIKGRGETNSKRLRENND